MKLGFFDSGIGGLSVLHLAMRKLPDNQFIYYADEKNVPYGEKSREEIVGYVNEAVEFMVEKGVKAIVIACNTATSAAISVMREKYNIPIIGMEPAIKKALDTYGDKRVLAAATPVTVKGEKMKILCEKVDKNHLVDLLPLPKLVRFAEKGEFDSTDVMEYITKSVSEYDLDMYSSLVLGCTHFNYFKDTFRKVLPESMSFVDGNAGTVNRLIHELNIVYDSNLSNQTYEVNGSELSNVQYYYSGKMIKNELELEKINTYLQRLDKMITIE